MTTVQVTEDRLFTDTLSYALSRVGLSSIALKQEQLTAIRYLYQRKDVFLWLPTGFGKSVCYEVLPFLFGFAGSKSGSIVPRWTELLLGLHTYCGKPSPSPISTNSSRLRRPGSSSFSPFRLNNEDDRFGDTSDEQTLHAQSLRRLRSLRPLNLMQSAVDVRSVTQLQSPFG